VANLDYAASAAKLLAERRANDPLAKWEPFGSPGGGQVAFLESDQPEAWYVGANRCGKSDAAAALTASMARHGMTNPRETYMRGGRLTIRDRAISAWVVSLTFPLSRDIIQAKIFNNGYVPAGQPHAPFIPDHEIANWSVTSQILRLKNGSIIGFKSCDQGRDLFQGTGKDLVVFDEAPDKSVYTECTLRVEAGRRLLIRGACTLLPPEGMVGGISWLFTDKIQPWQERSSSNLDICTASIYDNPHILRSEIERLEAMYPEGSVDRRIRLEGELLPAIAGSRAYPAFNRVLHVNPHLTMRHLDFRLPLLWAVDFNVEPMASTVWQCQDGVYRGFAEITIESDASPQSMADQFRRLFPTHGAELCIYGDASGQNRGQTGRSSYALLLDGLRNSKHVVRLYIPTKNPHIQDRVNSVNALLRAGDGRVRMEVCPQMVETIADFEGVLRDSKGGLKKTSNKSDPYFRRTHWTDGVGYMTSFRDPVRMGASDRARTVKIRQPGYTFGGPQQRRAYA
jgi:phage terminase large subunit-like protein